MLRRFIRPVVAIAALTGLGAYATIMLRGPQGLSALADKHREISTLEEQNANLQRDIQAKQERIERLKKDPSLWEVEVRKRLKMQREGETQFILSDPQSASPSSPNPPSDDLNKPQH